MYELYGHEYDARNCIFGGLHEFKFTVYINFNCSQISVYPVINASYMDGDGPRNVARAIMPMGGGTVRADNMWTSTCRFLDTTDGKAHYASSNGQDVICAIKSLDELKRVWDDALRLMNISGIFVFQNRSTDGMRSLVKNWTLKFRSVPYTGLVSESVEEGFSHKTYHLDATDKNYFYRTIGELTDHYKQLFTPAVLDELVDLFKTSFNKDEQNRRDQIHCRMKTLMALQEADNPLPPPPTVNEWWNGLTEVEKENIRAKSVPNPKTAKTAKKPAKTK